MTIGLTPIGFATESFDEIRKNLVTDAASRLGTSLDLGDQSVIGQLIAIVAAKVETCQNLAQAIYNATGDSATGDGLLNQCALTGTIPLNPLPSTVNLTLAGNAGVTINLGSQAQTAEGLVFEITQVKPLTALVSRAASTAYSVGDRRKNADHCYECVGEGTTSAGAGPSVTSGTQLDGTVTWRWIGTGSAVADATAQTLQNGEYVALADTIRTIKTPIAGWMTVTNLLDAVPGRLVEPDESLRLRRQAELAASGAHGLNAVRADLLTMLAAENASNYSVTIFNNTSDATVEGMPPHTFECLVRGGDSQKIADVIFDSTALGYRSHGNTSVVVTDSQGFEQTIKFSRPTTVDIYATLNILVDASKFPADGVALIKQQIVTWGDALACGHNAVASAIAAQAFKISGVLDVTSCLIGTAPSPTLSTTIAIALRELAAFDSSRIIVNVTGVTP